MGISQVCSRVFHSLIPPVCALAAMHHKSDALQAAAAEVTTNFVYVVLQSVLTSVPLLCRQINA